ncbi:hypothetical protein Cni_G06061 [Canna indica]|uniref:Bulb-type lectin domain-containing protein n=1 Tax=Canna indica TaxID=4628 RepID=A0AAQ3JWD5_9LILI|nr:hypothetical protein Cni_G06061 [Canna indica]
MEVLHVQILFCFLSTFVLLLLRPAFAIDALFNEPEQYLMAPHSLGQYGFELATNCSINYKKKYSSNTIPIHEGYSGVRGCQLSLDHNGTLGLFPAGEFEKRKFQPKPTRAGYYVLAGAKGHTMVHGPAIFCTPKELCRSDLPHATRPVAARWLRGDGDSGLGGAVVSGPATFEPGVVMSYGNYTLLLEEDCNLRIVDVTTGNARWSTRTVLPAYGAVSCEMVMSPQGELILQAGLKDGRIQRLYGTGVIAGKHGDPGHVYALRYDGRLMIYPPKPWSIWGAAELWQVHDFLISAPPSLRRRTVTCEYHYAYGDGSNVDGVLSSETLTFATTSGSSVTVKNFAFGCNSRSTGLFSNRTGERRRQPPGAP